MKISYFIFLHCVFSCISALESTPFLWGPHRISTFFEAGRLVRKREGGSYQKGTLVGVGGEYERLSLNSLYLFGEVRADKGTIEGFTGKEIEIRSRFSMDDYFGRIGWSFCVKKFLFAPFVGGGYSSSNNRFIDPSPLHISMKIHFPYTLAGLKVEWQKNPYLQWITSLQLKWPIEAKCSIKNDPIFFTTHQTVDKKTQVDFEIGARLQTLEYPCFGLESLFFYQYNNFGKHKNYPFNFLNTTHRFFGCRLALSIVF